jgi:hypothetical protein
MDEPPTGRERPPGLGDSLHREFVCSMEARLTPDSLVAKITNSSGLG